MAAHVTHLAVVAGRQPILQSLFMAGQICISDADLGKTQFLSPDFDVVGKLAIIDHKGTPAGACRVAQGQ